MITLTSAGELTDGTTYVDIDDIVHIEKNHPETFLVTVNDNGYNTVEQFYGDSADMIKAIELQNAYVEEMNS